MTQHHTSRLVAILRLIQSGRRNVDALALACNCSRRTVLRDIRQLRAAGVPIHFDSDQQCYTMGRVFALSGDMFTREETLALITICHEMGGERQLPFCEVARSAAQKFAALIPAEMLDSVQKVSTGVEIHLQNRMKVSTHGRQFFQTLLDSYARRTAVRIRYKAPLDTDEMTTLVSPYKILFTRHAWYLIGRSSIHRETRMFHVGRIIHIELTDISYTIPKGFTLRQFFGNAWQMVRDSGKDTAVVVRFSKMVATNVSDVQWHPTQRITSLPDGGIEFQVQVSGIREISYWILGYGKEAEVLQPPELREHIRQQLTAALNQYQ